MVVGILLGPIQSASGSIVELLYPTAKASITLLETVDLSFINQKYFTNQIQLSSCIYNF